MSLVSHYKRKCDKDIGGCGKVIDISETVSVVRGKFHLCKKCAGKELNRIMRYDIAIKHGEELADKILER